jgi:proline iminopeptidase
MAAYGEEYLEANGNRFWTVQCGEGIPLVLCHGGPGACDNLEPVAAMISDLAHVYRYDQRGCGRSSSTPPYDLLTYLEDLQALRTLWGLDRCIIAGHSWGASLALAYTLRRPQDVAAMVLLSTNGLENYSAALLRTFEKRLTPSEQQTLQKLRDRFRVVSGREEQDVLEKILQLKLKADLADAATAVALPHFPYPMNQKVYRRLTEDWEAWLRTPDLERQIEGLTVPALVVHGNADPRPSRGAYHLAGLLPHGKFISLPGVGHYPWLEHPHLLRTALRDFVVEIQGQLQHKPRSSQIEQNA